MADTPPSRRRVRQAVPEIETFVATLSHDLRTPLTAIVGWADIMQKGVRSGEEFERAVEAINRNAENLSGVVSALLEFLPHALERARETEPELDEEEEMPMSADVTEPNLAGVHVLIVEDDPDGNELVRTILERYGARVSSATTAGAALDILAFGSERPHILVSDIGLPDMNGMELIECVRARGDVTLPAVALTAYASRADATKAIAAGFDAHVAKPVQPATLGRVVSSALGRGREGCHHARALGSAFGQ